MRGTRIPTAKRVINSVAPLDPADLSEANANNLMFLWDNMGTGEYMEDDSILARHFANLRAREQTTPNLTLQVQAGAATFATTFVAFAGGNSPSFTAPVTNPRIDMLSINSSGTLVRTAGTEAASPVAPAVPANNIPLCLVRNVVGQTTIRDFDSQVVGQGYVLTDLRPFIGIGGSMIKSIQRGVVSITYTTASSGQSFYDAQASATITSVDTTKAHALFMGLDMINASNGTVPAGVFGRIELLNATTVRGHLNTTLPAFSGGTVTFEIGFEVVEFL